MTILILTVGGSHQPLVTSIQQLKPDMVYFLCSDDSKKTVNGEGNVLKSKLNLEKCDLPNIITLAELSESQYSDDSVRKIKDFDNLSDCYKESFNLIQELHEKFPEARIIADYTGGTKSMSTGLAMSAIDDEKCEIMIVTGIRRDLIKVTDKTQTLHPVNVKSIQIDRGLKEAKKLLKRFDYAGTKDLLESLAVRYEMTEKLQRSIILCRAFEAWDIFNHESALSLINIYRKDYIDYAMFLEAIINPGKGHGYEMVEDIVLNAERRASQDRYDDAVARLYRATEMLAQAKLKRYEINTSDLDLAKVNDTELRSKFGKYADDKGKVKIGLRDAWDLLITIPQEVLTEHYNTYKCKIMTFLECRNSSILAHGIKPIDKSKYSSLRESAISFIMDGIKKSYESESRSKRPFKKASQLPVDFL
jgi:hypothetical protein